MKATIEAQIAFVQTPSSEANVVNNASCYKIQRLIDLEKKSQVRMQKNTQSNMCNSELLLLFILRDGVALQAGKEKLTKVDEHNTR